jgi:hypothetical protein
MALSAIDAKIVTYLPQLGMSEKKSILEVIKSFVKLKGNEEFASVSIEEYNIEIEEAMMVMDKGEAYTHEEAKKIASAW